MKRETVEIQKELFDGTRSQAGRYAELVVGRRGVLALLKYEFVNMFGGVPGALGLVLRSRLYPWLLGSCGRNVTFGLNVVLRHPHKIHIGDNVAIDDNCLLDAKGSDNKGIRIGNGVFVGRNTILSCKNGDIVLADRANLGFNCEIFSASSVVLGEDVLVAAYTYFVGGGHDFDRADLPVLRQGRCSRGIEAGAGAWFGAGVRVLDGVRVGAHSICGAGAVVTGDIPDRAVAVGVPARVVRTRGAQEAGPEEGPGKTA